MWRDTIWCRPDDWGFDAPDHVFVANACLKLGKAMFGDRWTGLEMVQVREYKKDIRKQLKWDVIGGSELFEKVKLSIREHCASGRLQSFVQFEDGTFWPLPSTSWNTLDCRDWFHLCGVPGPQLFRRNPLAGPHNYPLYIGRKGLERIVKPSGSPDRTPKKRPDISRLTQWCEKYLADALENGQPLLADDELWKMAKADGFPNVSRATFRQVWHTVKPPEAAGRGPRRLVGRAVKG